jgi:fatty acid/phospholipid biosynthesis enzyme
MVMIRDYLQKRNTIGLDAYTENGIDVIVRGAMRFLGERSNNGVEVLIAGDFDEVRGGLERRTKHLEVQREIEYSRFSYVSKWTLSNDTRTIYHFQAPGIAKNFSAARENDQLPDDSPEWTLMSTQALYELLNKEVIKAAVSAGSTDACVYYGQKSAYKLRHVFHPILVSKFPNRDNPNGIMVAGDIGACLSTNGYMTIQHVIMAAAYAHALGIENPRIGLLGVGQEEYKNTAILRQKRRLVEAYIDHFQPSFTMPRFAEGDDYFGANRKKVREGDLLDCIVSDGDHGNPILKTSEGIARMIQQLSGWESLVYLVLKHKIKKVLKSKSAERSIDPAAYGGAALVGVKHPFIKTHGASRPKAIYYSLRDALELAQMNFDDEVALELDRFMDDTRFRRRNKTPLQNRLVPKYRITDD